MRDQEFDFIRNLVYQHSRIQLSSDKRAMVNARLGKRLRATKHADVGSYCSFLQTRDAQEEVSHLIDAISTNHTFFFREQAHFDFLRDHVLPEMVQRQRQERWARFNLWSAACSSGEEPYSLAICLAESLPASLNWPWRIEATDISHRILSKARAAIYRDDVIERMPSEYVRKYCQKGMGPMTGHYRIKPALTGNIGYHQLNLLEGSPPFSQPFQVIFCRNVMIYFDRPTQEELIQRLTTRLVPGGYLMVGHSESLSGIKHTLKMIRPAIYQRSMHP